MRLSGVCVDFGVFVLRLAMFLSICDEGCHGFCTVSVRSLTNLVVNASVFWCAWPCFNNVLGTNLSLSETGLSSHVF